MLAIHGLTGHGRTLATTGRRLARNRHRRTRSARPRQVVVGRAVDHRRQRRRRWPRCSTTKPIAPVLVVGHSFGGAIAMHLAAARPDQVAALLLLDPAIGLDGVWMSQIAEAMFSLPRLPGRRRGTHGEGDGLLGRRGPRAARRRARRAPGRAAERTVRLAGQHAGDDVVLERVGPRRRVAACGNARRRWCGRSGPSPPYVTDRLIDALRQRLGADFQLLDFECDHMVPNAKPVEVAALIREHFEKR